MHLIHLKESVDLGKTVGVLQPGDYLLHDQNAYEIALKAPRGSATVKDHRWLSFLSQEKDAPTLIMRSGAIGDLLMLTPALKERLAVTKQLVGISCWKHEWPLFENLAPQIVFLEAYPLPLSRVNEYKAIISLENTMEMDHENNASDVFAKALGVETPLKSYKPLYVATEEEKLAVSKHLFLNRPNVALQMRASVANRTYPFPLWLEVIKGLEKRGWGVLLLGKKGQIPNLPENHRSPYIRNLAEEDLTLRESVAVLSQCDAFCGVDSAFMHFAAALDIPSVTLFAAFPWQLRTNHYPKNTAISGVGACAPCYWHMHDGQEFPPNKPCTPLGQCVVLATIEPSRIISKVDALKP